MAYRGGSQYDDLTPREQEVLSLIRDGYSDGEIAERLGLRLGAVHYHQANIYAKLGVSTREEAAAWEPSDEPLIPPKPLALTLAEPPPATDEAATEPASSVTVARGPDDQPPSVRAGLTVLAAAFAAIGLIVGGGAVVGLDLGSGDTLDSDAAAVVGGTQTPRPARTLRPGEPTPYNYFAEDPYWCCQQPTPGPTPTSEFEVLTLESGVRLPPGIALLIKSSCTGDCTGRTNDGIGRVYVRPDGTIAQEVLFDPATLGITREDPRGGPMDPYIVSYAFSANGSDIAVALCVHLFCGGHGFADADAVTVIYRSTDGGVSWQESPFPNDTYIVGITSDGDVIVVKTDQTTAAQVFLSWPDGSELTSPVPDGWPSVVSGGDLIWIRPNGVVYDTSGDVIVDLNVLAYEGAYPWQIAASDDGLFVIWSGYESNNGIYGNFLTRFVYGATGDTIQFNGISWLASHDSASGFPFIATVTPSDFHSRPPGLTGTLPGILDLKSRTVAPITTPFLDDDFIFAGDYNVVQAVQYGPFARVTGTGSCLNVRDEPSLEGSVIECAADGVLLTIAGQILTSPPPEWVAITTPAGHTGWVATEYVEY